MYGPYLQAGWGEGETIPTGIEEMKILGLLDRNFKSVLLNMSNKHVKRLKGGMKMMPHKIKNINEVIKNYNKQDQIKFRN